MARTQRRPAPLAGAAPLPPGKKWRAILLASLVFAPAYWAIVAGMVSAASDEAGAPAAGPFIGFGLAVIPFVFVVLAFLSEHPRAPGAAAKAMRDSAEKAGPVMGHGRPSRAQLYNRGPLLLFALEQRIGRAKMNALMVEISRGTPNTAVQFFAALRATAGDAQVDWFQAALLSEKLEK